MSVAQILQALAENAGRKHLMKGQLLGGAISDAAQVPAQIIADRRKQALVDAEQRRQDEAMSLRRSEDVRQQGAYGRQQQTYLEGRDRDQVMRQAYRVGAEGSGGDPAKFNIQASLDFAAQSSYPEIGRDILDHYRATQKPIQPLLKTGKDEIVSDPNQPPDPTTGQYPVVARGPKGAPTTAELDAEQQRILAKPEAARTPEETAAANAYNARKDDASTVTVKTMENGKPVEKILSKSDALRLGVFPSQPPAPVLYPKEKIDKLVKVEHKDPATGRTVIEWLPESQLQGQTFDKGVGSAVEARLSSAQAVNQTGNDIIARLQDPAFVKTLGPAMGRYSKLRDFIGNPPPEYKELAGLIESYSLANMGVHGMRSALGAKQIQALLDQPQTPASIISAIKGLNAFSQHFMANEGRVDTNPPVQAAPTSGPKVGESRTVGNETRYWTGAEWSLTKPR